MEILGLREEEKLLISRSMAVALLARAFCTTGSAWSTGSLKGLRARGGLAVDVNWKDGKVTNYRLASAEPRDVMIRVNGEVKKARSEKADIRQE